MNIQGFVGPAYSSISKAINAQRCINWRLEVDLANGKAPVSLVGLPGYIAIKDDLPAGEVRGFWRAAGRVFAVVRDTLYELHSDLTHTVRGTLSTMGGIVSMTDNGLDLLIVDGVGVLALKLATSVATNTIANFPYGATFIVCVDNTMIANEPGSQRFRISAVGNAYGWSVVDFASVEGSPDDLVAIVAFSRQLYFLGSESLQVFWNSGNATRPFVSVEGSFVEVGCIAPRSAVEDESGVYWLGADSRGGPRVYKASGGQAAPISTPAMDNEFAGSNGQPGYVLEDAQACTLRMDGHVFYVLTFPTTDRTWIFDATTDGWSEFNEWDTAWHRHRSNCTIHAFGMQIIGDFANGKLYRMASDIYSNDGRPLRALRASAHVSKDEAMLTIGNLQVVCERGVGLTTGQGSDPQMMLRTSVDGANNWTSEMWRSIGKTGEFKGVTRWNRPCRAARSFVFEVSITDPVKRTIVKGLLNV